MLDLTEVASSSGRVTNVVELRLEGSLAHVICECNDQEAHFQEGLSQKYHALLAPDVISKAHYSGFWYFLIRHWVGITA